MPINKCCGEPLDNGCKLVVIWQWIFAAFSITRDTLYLFPSKLDSETSGDEEDILIDFSTITNDTNIEQLVADLKSEAVTTNKIEIRTHQLDTFDVVSTYVLIVVYALSALIALILFVGAHQRNKTKCWIWFSFNFLHLIGIAVYIVSYSYVKRASFGFFILWPLYFLIHVKLVSVVWQFIGELKEGKIW